ncbi:MAG: very short patch repair endonuclease [Candidatus Binatia bacterium]
MSDILTPEQRSERMGRVRGKDTRPELVVRRIVHGMGFRYRLHRRNLPGSPDLVFARRKKVIFIHGCYWHRHPDPACKLARLPKSRLDFWRPKLEGNRQRDLHAQQRLCDLGWHFVVVWECAIRHKEQLKNRIRLFLEGPECDLSSFLPELGDLGSASATPGSSRLS